MMPYSSTSQTIETILIVDDQEPNIQILGQLLTSMGFDVIPATGGEQALQRLEACQPDLILLDVLMPGMDGFAVCARLKEHPAWSKLPIIFVSAANDTNIIVRALEAGGVDYVTKPYQKAELLSRVRTHLALKRAQDDLRSLAEDKDELLGILAHDLKNHLSGMQLSASLLADRVADLPENSGRLVQNIFESSTRMLSFVKEFLANQHAERIAPAPEALDAGEQTRAAVERHRTAAAVKNITLNFKPPAQALQMRADREAAAQVLDNLVSNAIKFSPPGKNVHVRVEDGPFEWITLAIKDEGPGFSDEDRQKMFRRYARLTAKPTSGEPSTGLGLSIVKRLVEAMKGRINVESEPGAGAEFFVRLPAVR
ncbi:MAG: hybrid sensor histidine kinase/response regulator [Verrucomicrobiales bacterium]